jgi:hypothetical protein
MATERERERERERDKYARRGDKIFIFSTALICLDFL